MSPFELKEIAYHTEDGVEFREELEACQDTISPEDREARQSLKAHCQDNAAEKEAFLMLKQQSQYAHERLMFDVIPKSPNYPTFIAGGTILRHKEIGPINNLPMSYLYPTILMEYCRGSSFENIAPIPSSRLTRISHQPTLNRLQPVLRFSDWHEIHRALVREGAIRPWVIGCQNDDLSAKNVAIKKSPGGKWKLIIWDVGSLRPLECYGRAPQDGTKPRLRSMRDYDAAKSDIHVVQWNETLNTMAPYNPDIEDHIQQLVLRVVPASYTRSPEFEHMPVQRFRYFGDDGTELNDTIRWRCIQESLFSALGDDVQGGATERVELVLRYSSRLLDSAWIHKYRISTSDWAVRALINIMLLFRSDSILSASVPATTTNKAEILEEVDRFGDYLSLMASKTYLPPVTEFERWAQHKGSYRWIGGYVWESWGDDFHQVELDLSQRFSLITPQHISHILDVPLIKPLRVSHTKAFPKAPRQRSLSSGLTQAHTQLLT